MGFFKKFKEAWLASMTFDRLDDDFYEELEEALILADIGAATAADTVAQLRKRVSQKLLGRTLSAIFWRRSWTWATRPWT